jgi:PBSX family phage terminase large subunit
MSFRYTAKQEEALEILGGQAKNILLYGGTQSAKTFLLITAIIIRALRSARSKHAIFRLKSTDVKASVVFNTYPDVLRLRFPQLEEHMYLNKTHWYGKLPNGSEIWFAGLDDNKESQKVLGRKFSTIFLNEASEIPYSAYSICLPRLSEQNELKKKIFIDENPPYNKNHWTYKMFFEYINPKENASLDRDQYARLQMNPSDNLDNLPKDYLESLESLPEREKNRFLYGEFGDGVDGGVYTKELLQAQREARIGEVEIDWRYPLHAVFDLGISDATAVWICQFQKDKVLLVDYFENTGEPFHWYVAEIFKRGHVIETIYLPHDAKSRNLASGLSLAQVSQRLGTDPVVPRRNRFGTRILDKIPVFDGINAARMLLRACWFDKKKCALGLENLRNYRYVMNEKLGVYEAEPLHDWSSHGADAFRYVAQAYYRILPPEIKPKRDPSKIYADDLIRSRQGVRGRVER